MKKTIHNIMDFLYDFNIPICLFGLYVLLTHTMNIENCLVQWIIGYPCPGCGMTRAVLSIGRLDFRQAFLYNPFVFFLPFIGLAIAFKHTKVVKFIMRNKWISIAVILSILVGYIVRMIYIYPNEPMDYFEHNLIAFIFSWFN